MVQSLRFRLSLLPSHRCRGRTLHRKYVLYLLVICVTHVTCVAAFRHATSRFLIRVRNDSRCSSVSRRTDKDICGAPHAACLWVCHDAKTEQNVLRECAPESRKSGVRESRHLSGAVHVMPLEISCVADHNQQQHRVRDIAGQVESEAVGTRD